MRALLVAGRADLLGLYRRSDFNQVPVGIIKPDYLLSPAVCHQAVDILGFGIERHKSFDKPFDVRFFKIQLLLIVFWSDTFPCESLPVARFLQIQVIRQLHVSVVVLHKAKSEQIMIELKSTAAVFDNNERSLVFHVLLLIPIQSACPLRTTLPPHSASTISSRSR